MKKYISLTLSALILLPCIAGCGDKDNESQSRKETSTEALATTKAVEETTVDWQSLKDEYNKDIEKQEQSEKKSQEETASGIIKHTNRPYEGIYIEDYITVTFSGYEHDSECELSVNWDAIADELGNGITPEMLETMYDVRLYNDHDLANGDEINISMDNKTLQEAFKQKFSSEIEYVDDNVFYYEKTPVIVSGLMTKVFVQDATEVDMTVLTKYFDNYMVKLKDDTQDYDDKLPRTVKDQLNNKEYKETDIDQVIGRDKIMSDDTDYCRINDYSLEGTYLATRTMSSYNDSNAADLPENMVFNIYKLSMERYSSEEKFDIYYLTGMSDLLFEENKMIITDEMVEADFKATFDELMPNSQYFNVAKVG